MRVRFLTADVFTDQPFGGNQLAVFPDAREIDPALMLPITREFNFSETTFVLPPDNPSSTARVRIFTPGGELPFAGHPTIGTAHVLGAIGQVKLDGASTAIVFEELAGLVPVTIRADGGKPTFCQLTAALAPEFGPEPPAAERLAAMLSLPPSAILSGEMRAEVVSCGVPFLFIPLADRAAVAAAKLRLDVWQEVLAGFFTSNVFVFAMDGERASSNIHSRMFAPSLGIAEDPATGGAAVALAGYLAARRAEPAGSFAWTIEQGFEMGRPSILEIEAEKREGKVTATRVGGSTVIMTEGWLTI